MTIITVIGVILISATSATQLAEHVCNPSNSSLPNASYTMIEIFRALSVELFVLSLMQTPAASALWSVHALAIALAPKPRLFGKGVRKCRDKSCLKDWVLSLQFTMHQSIDARLEALDAATCQCGLLQRGK